MTWGPHPRFPLAISLLQDTDRFFLFHFVFSQILHPDLSFPSLLSFGPPPISSLPQTEPADSNKILVAGTLCPGGHRRLQHWAPVGGGASCSLPAVIQRESRLSLCTRVWVLMCQVGMSATLQHCNLFLRHDLMIS